MSNMQVTGVELSSLPFDSLIGGPLLSIVDACAQSALTTAAFVKDIGFEPPPFGNIVGSSMLSTGKALMITFSYDAVNYKTAKPVPRSITIPFLSMLTIPTLRLAEATVEFNARIDSYVSKLVDSDMHLDLQAGLAVYDQENPITMFNNGVALMGKIALKRKTKNGSTHQKLFTMRYKCKMSGQALPSGLQRVLDVLDQNFKAEGK
eukprot:CAMPEP_0177640744 /NCGR_PEP_ID=MMETSP0447-20121125/6702_1 /TAXON_ID=0 /ORGANISM="Stygamoeba regulata, Strain BSH-02190019" /LENGTH=205 /DNA_ID=CAMNT_0019142827 /DNA_START=163 /DNA_END=780 /DNA_ORIENTATION=-